MVPVASVAAARTPTVPTGRMLASVDSAEDGAGRRAYSVSSAGPIT